MSKQFKLVRPLDAHWKMSQRFGENPDFYSKFGNAGHGGIDYGVAVGNNVYAGADGEVFEVRSADDPMGINVRIRHIVGGREYQTIYAHLSKPMVSVGDSVKAGQVIALSGNTGRYTSGPHLHFALKRIGIDTPGYKYNLADPWPYLEGQPPPESKPLEPSDLTIYTTDKVRMRDGPATSYAEVAWLTKDEALTVLGDANAARAKVGQKGQWIPARRADGTDGYVAAWYAQLKPDAPAPAEPKAEPKPEPIPEPKHEPEPELEPKPKPEIESKPEPEPTGALVVYATEPLNVRESPALGAARTAVALPDEALTVIGDPEVAKANIGDRGDWLNVRLADGSENYVAAWYVQLKPGAAVESITVYPTEDMNMRNRPDTSGDLVQRVVHNAPLKVHDSAERAQPLVGQHGEWLYVETKDGQRGWVAAWYVSTATT